MSSESGLVLSFERLLDVPCEHLWRGWTEPELMKKWFTPAPWVTVEAEVDARPGGIFRTVMQGPNGERNEGAGCVLEAVPNRRFAWTSALGPGFVPNAEPEGGFLFTAILEFEPVDTRSRYRATALHATAEFARAHAEIGFEAGWNAALDQLIALHQG